MLLGAHLVRAVLAIFPLTVAVPAVSVGVGGLENYDVEPMQWEVRAFSDGPLIPMNGTVQEVMTKLRELNPDFDESNAPDHDTLQKRTDFVGGRSSCNRNVYEVAEPGPIEDGIAYLRKVPGSPVAGPHSGRCGRVSCSWWAAIWWCNETPEPMTLPSFSYIADGAQFVHDNCNFKYRADTLVGGRVTHKTGWKVIVGHADC